MLQESNVNENIESTKTQLQALQSKHSQLESALKKAQKRPQPDALAINEVKREKLALKDRILRLSQN
jgi:hypothetical protein